MRKKLKPLFLAGLASLFSNCTILQRIAPNRLELGVMVREISGKNRLLKDKKSIPFLRVQANKEFGEDVQGYLRLDSTSGRVSTSSYSFEGGASGGVTSFGAGLQYFPFGKKLSFDLGGEAFYSDIGVRGKLGDLRTNSENSFFGAGLTTGATYRSAISENANLVISGAYNFSSNRSIEIKYDFDGLSYFIGIDFALK